jgi:hypothetical protein
MHGTKAAAEHGVERSPHWHTVEKHFLEKNASCALCIPCQHNARLAQVGERVTRGLQVHHFIIPFHYAVLLERPDLELDERNLITLCEDEEGVKTEDHHNLVGHLRNFQSYNPDIPGAIKLYRGWSKARILADAKFLALCAALPKKWPELSASERQALRKMLDQKLPILKK